MGFENSGKTSKEKFCNYSSFEAWIGEVEKIVEIEELNKVKTIVFVSSDLNERLIKLPKSVFLKKCELEYLGIFEFLVTVKK
jgi:hypothetical protein